MWNFRKNNLLVNDKDKLFIHRVHLENLLHAKSYINNKGKETPYFIKYKLSRRKFLRDQESKINYENSIIFSRLVEINKSISPYSSTYRPIYCASFDRKKYTYNESEKRREIFKDNLNLFKRLVHEKSFYITKKILKSNDFELYLKEIIKRQRTDNPNIKFATFYQFKKNLSKNYKLKKSYSAGMLVPACFNNINKNHNTDTILIPNSRNLTLKKNYSSTSNFNDNNAGYINEYKFKGKNSKNTISTMNSTKKGKNMNRCQSAFLKKNINNNNY
jgi:hypothetical protein